MPDTPDTAPNYSPHPYAKIFPLMEIEAFTAFVEDIKVNGLREAITINARNQVLDGLNRYRACLEAGVEPRFERKEISDKDALAFILSRNLHRRHMTTAQRAAAAAAAVRLSKSKPANLRITQAQVANLFHVSERAVHQALGVLDRSPELHEAAVAGQVSTHLSGQIAALPKPERDDALKRLKDGDRKGARVLIKAPSKAATKNVVAATLPKKRTNTPFKGNAVYAPLFGELDLLADHLAAYPLAPSDAQQLIAELRRAIERTESAINAALSK